MDRTYLYMIISKYHPTPRPRKLASVSEQYSAKYSCLSACFSVNQPVSQPARPTASISWCKQSLFVKAYSCYIKVFACPIFSSYLGSGPASTVHPRNISGNSRTPKIFERGRCIKRLFCHPPMRSQNKSCSSQVFSY